MPAIFLILSRLKLRHFLALGAIIIVMGSLTYAWTLKTQLRASESRYNGFVAEVDSAASKQVAKNAIETAARDKITQELRFANEKLQSDLTGKYAEYRRLLNPSAGSGRMPALPDASAGIAKPEYEARLVRALGQLEARVLSELAESRDGAIMQSNMCADWLREQKLVP